MKQEQIRISCEWGEIMAELAASDAARSLEAMLPLTIAMRDHMRQEKTGTLASPLTEGPRQRDFSVGMLGLWDADHFVIYYRAGRVPLPGIVVLGRIIGDVTIFDRPGPITVTIQRADSGE